MRFPPRTILMPFAFSAPSFAAWSFARSCARRFGAKLIALHVYGWIMPAGGFQRPLSLAEKKAVREKMADSLGPEVALRFAEGGVARAVLQTALDTKADLILMATAGRTGLRRLGRDSITEEVVRHSPVPVLSVHGYSPMPQSILAPVNLEPYSLAGCEAAEQWARVLELPLTLLNVHEKADPRSGVMTRVALRETAAKAHARLKLRQGDPVKEILGEVDRERLVVMVAHRKGLLHDAILGTTAEQILRRSPGPVLTIPGSTVKVAVSRRRAMGRRRVSSASRRARSLRRTII